MTTGYYKANICY